MTDAFVIEIQDETAGIVVRNGRDYFFYASHPRYAALEGSAFATPSRAEHAARTLRNQREADGGVERACIAAAQLAKARPR